jgi:cystathionine gamma-lyase
MYKTQPDYFAMNEKYAKLGLGTRLVHAGSEPGKEFGGVSTTLDFSTTFAQPAPGTPVVFDYARCGNPTRLALERSLASMECAKYAFACSSGMAAHITITNLCKRGDHILCVDDVYGGTQRYLRTILGPNAEIEVSFEDFSDIKHFKKCLKPNTKVVWLETPTNPTLKCFDIAKIADALKGTGILLCVDNTFSTPVNTNPLLLGADVVTHSLTKYIGGHSDIIAGCICLNDRELYDKLFFILKSMGTGLCAFDSWLVLRSAKTLEVRVNQANKNALAVAKTLEASPKVQRVIYPGLKSHPQYSMMKKQSRGSGGMVSFYIKGGVKQAEKFLTSLKYFTLAESLGGVESLAENPALMTHGSVPAAHRKLLGIEDNFIRLSVGIESEQDLVNDIKQALAKA